MNNIINKQLISNLNTAAINGAKDIFVELLSFARLELGLKTTQTNIWGSYEVEKREEATKQFDKWMSDRGYIETLIGTVVWHVLPGNDGVPKAIFVLNDRHGSFHGTLIGDPTEAEAIKDHIKQYAVKREGMHILTAQMGHGMMGRSMNYEREFIPTDELELATEAFYPWMTVSLEEYFKAYLESNQSVLILIGPPGTGKSTFIRTLFKYLHDTKQQSGILAYDPEVVGSVDLVNNFFRSDEWVLAYEDMDAWLGKREDGNPFMATLLNQTNGVVRRKQKKLIFSTNLQNTKSIDEALMRKGRCFDILEFSKLRPEDAERIAIERDLPVRDFSSQSEWSLAEVLVAEDKAIQRANRFGRKIGFN